MSSGVSKTLYGVKAAEGVAYGKVYLRNFVSTHVENIEPDNPDIELQLFFDAKVGVRHDIKELIHFSKQINQKSTIDILETQINILEDPELQKQITLEIVEQKKAASSAINSVFNKYIGVLEDTGSELFQSRIIDIKDLRRRMLVRVNRNREFEEIDIDHILVARDVSPTELMEYIRIGIKGIALEEGGVSSHTAIVAHAMNIPCLIKTKGIRAEATQGTYILLDADNGRVVLNPTKEQAESATEHIRKEEIVRNQLQDFIETPSQTRCGQSFNLHANLEFVEELSLLQKHKISGIGLLRTESQFLMKGHFPDRKSQISFYNTIFTETIGPVTVRLFDVGGDKLIGEQIKEPNPFLGWRGVRILLDRPSILKTQLEALIQVHLHHPGRLRIMVPMIMDVGEVRAVRQMLNEVLEKYKVTEQPLFGTMIEIPSSVMLIQEILNEVDFVSIGSNDLTQYMLAVDRGNSRIVEKYESLHPAVLRTIKVVIDAAKQRNKLVSLCGEMASDALSAKILLGMGLSEMSMVGSAILRVKKELTATTLEECQQLANQFLAVSSLDEVAKLRMSH